MSTFKICAVVIVYYPEIHKVVSNIQKYYSFINHLIIWDNTPKKDSIKYKLPFDGDNITYLTTGENIGIAKALNTAAEWAIQNNYTHLLTMDQDSHWENFCIYKKEVEKNLNSHYAAYAPLIFDAKRKTIGFNSKTQFITSGAIYSLKHYLIIGKFCEVFTIDCVDTEYALRIQKNRFNVKIITNSYLIQNFGDLKKIKILGCYYANYSPFRLYHILRNNIWMWRMYRQTQLLTNRFLFNDIIYRYLIREPLLVLLSGSNKTSKLKALLEGLFDGIFHYKKSFCQTSYKECH